MDESVERIKFKLCVDKLKKVLAEKSTQVKKLNKIIKQHYPSHQTNFQEGDTDKGFDRSQYNNKKICKVNFKIIKIEYTIIV